METYAMVAEKVLRDAGGPLSVKQITERAIKDYSFRHNTKTPEASMWSRICEEMKRAGTHSTFKKTGKKFDLRRRSPSGETGGDGKGGDGKGGDGKGGDGKGGDGKGGDGKYTKDPLYVGAAGEHRVESELLFRGYDASMTSVDKGIDVVARKDGHVFDIQVKTVSRHKTGSHVVSINERSFRATKSQGMHYAFVLRSEAGATDFVILPYSEMKRLIEQGKINKNKAGYQVTFKVGANDITVGKSSVSFYRNNWDLGQLG